MSQVAAVLPSWCGVGRTRDGIRRHSNSKGKQHLALVVAALWVLLPLLSPIEARHRWNRWATFGKETAACCVHSMVAIAGSSVPQVCRPRVVRVVAPKGWIQRTEDAVGSETPRREGLTSRGHLRRKGSWHRSSWRAPPPSRRVCSRGILAGLGVVGACVVAPLALAISRVEAAVRSGAWMAPPAEAPRAWKLLVESEAHMFGGDCNC